MLKIILIIKFFLFSYVIMSSDFYKFNFQSIEGEEMSMKEFKGQVVLLVNTASMCGLTKQYSALQDLYQNYKDKGLVILGVPSNSFKQEHSSEDRVKDFCETNFDISFPMTKIENVIGSEKHPLYAWLKEKHGIKPKWNFHKVLIGKSGNIVNSFSSLTSPKSNKLLKEIEEQIKG